MPVKIHHGAPGAYKTSGAVLDDLVPWAVEGRVVVTNVRGLESTALFRESYAHERGRRRGRRVLPPLGDGFELIYLDTEGDAEARERMRLWFTWAPVGCAFLIDEIQTIYPQAFTVADYRALAFPSQAEAVAAGRPENVYIAFEKHRHFNWDFVVTAPSIKKVPPIVRDIAEVAYYHNNKGKIGLRGFYLEAMHNPADAGTREAQWIQHAMKRAPKLAFALYASTATSVVKDTEAGRNIFTTPRMVVMYVLFGCAVAFLISRGNPLTRGAVAAQEAADAASSPVAAVTASSPIASSAPAPSVAARPAAARSEGRLTRDGGRATPGRAARVPRELDDAVIEIGGEFFGPFVYVTMSGHTFEVTADELAVMGYRVERRAGCLWRVVGGLADRFIHCRDPDGVVPPSTTPARPANIADDLRGADVAS